MNLMEEKIRKCVKELRIQTNKKYAVLSWCIFISSLFLALVFVFVAFLGGILTFLGLFFGFLFLILGISLFFIFKSQAKQISKNNQKKMTSLNSSLHGYYFENNPHFFPKELKFKGICSSNVFSNHSFAFNWNTESINWHISEERKYNSSNQTSTYTLEFRLVSSAKNFLGFDNIYITEGKTDSEPPFCESKSIIFNERFKVKGNNQMQVYKVLTPKIIENFLVQENNFLHPKMIRIYDGTVSVSWKGSPSRKSWIPDPLDYSAIHWTKKQMIGEIYQKINTDFTRYLVIQKMLVPLDLY